MTSCVMFNDRNLSCVPSKEMCIDLINDIKRILFPNFYQCDYEEPELLENVKKILNYQLKCAYTLAKMENDTDYITDCFIKGLPKIAKYLITDLNAAYEGDPASYDKVEIILAYPGFEAIIIYRIAHSLYDLQVPYIPRMLSEYAHSITGIDIHPGASIGKSIFIDHGTGVVIGETSVIGDNVRIYQGVTLGALSLKEGHNLKGIKRHPTIGNGVTIYANATILGGDTFIDDNVTIGANSYILKSVFYDKNV